MNVKDFASKGPASVPKSFSAAMKVLEDVTLPSPVFTGEATESIIPESVRHLIMITGLRGKGKTFFTLGIDDPNNVLFFDYESKGEGVAKEIGVGAYYSINDDCVAAYGAFNADYRVYQRTLQILEAVPNGRFTTLVLDNGGELQAGCLSEIQRAPEDYNQDPEKVATGSYGGAWIGVKHLLSNIFHLARTKGIKVIAVTFQPTGVWKDGRPVFNKFKASDVAIWHQMSVLSLVLVDGTAEHFPAPSALVMKESLGKVSWNRTTKTMEAQRRLPLKLPKATMSEVYRYLAEPADLKSPAAGEMPAAGEIEMWNQSFSKDQIKALETAAKLYQALEEDKQ